MIVRINVVTSPVTKSPNIKYAESSEAQANETKEASVKFETRQG